MLRLQLKRDDCSRRAFNRALVAAGAFFLFFLFGINRIWRLPKGEIVRLSLRATPAQIVMRDLTSCGSAKSRRAKKSTTKKVALSKKSDLGKASVIKKEIAKKPAVKKKTVSKPVVQKKPVTKSVAQKKKPVSVKKKQPAGNKSKSAPLANKKSTEVKAPVKKNLEGKKKTVPTVNLQKKEVLEKNAVLSKKNELKVVEKVASKEKKTKAEKPIKKQVLDKKIKEVVPSAQSKKNPVNRAKEATVAPRDEVVKPLEELAKKEVFEGKKLEAVAQQKLADTPIPVVSGSGVDGVGFDRDTIALVAAIRRVWRLPRGLKTDLRAHVLLKVGGKGSVEEVKIVRSSGVVAYDLAARAALHRAVYPQAFWGKSILIEFGKELGE